MVRCRIALVTSGLLVVLSRYIHAQDLQAIRSAMRESVELQKASIHTQLKTLAPHLPVARTEAQIFPTAPLTGCEALPEPQIAQIVNEAGQREGVSSALIREVVRQESGGKPCAVSVAGAQGLMQLMPSTQAHFGVSNPFSPQESISAGTKLLRQLLTRYGGDLKLALSAYNAGTEAVDKARAVPNIPETQDYVSTILRRLR